MSPPKQETEGGGDARDLALAVLRRVFTQGAYASTVLRHEMPSVADPSDRALATELVYGILRRRAFLDRALTKAAGRRLKDLDPKLHDVLRVGAYQLLYLDRVPDHAAVHSAVEQAKARRGTRGGRTANAILRKISDQPPDLRIPQPSSASKDPSERVSQVGGLPRPLAELLVQDLGPQAAEHFAVASLQPAPLTLRANLLKTARDALQAELEAEPGEHPRAVRLQGERGLPAELRPCREGRATPQDEASMGVVDLLDPQPGERVLDVCAAPGGKTTYAAERSLDRAQIEAYDRHPRRLAEVEKNAARLGLTSIQTIDVLPEAHPNYDRVLVDAPCSGLGTLRRHPEIRWRFRPEDLASLQEIQSEVLRDGALRLKPGGSLVYSVCTVTQREGALAIQPLLDQGYVLLDLLNTGPHQPGAPDGFFAAHLRKPG